MLGDPIQTPKQLGFRMPAEWEQQEAVWLAWPHNKETWPGKLLEESKISILQFVKVMAEDQKVKLLVDNKMEEKEAEAYLQKIQANLHNVLFFRIQNVDAWMRDCAPAFLVNNNAKEKAMLRWDFNAWGDKYGDLKQDKAVPFEMSKSLNLRMFEPKMVLEGGSIDVNGTGTVLTTEQCLLNKNRNPKLSKEQIEQNMKDYLSVRNILWLKEGIVGDDTDGHIDDIARFVGKNTVVCVFEKNKNDENYEILRENYDLLRKMKDESGKKLNVIKLPMPGVVEIDETRLPASYANFYIGNKTVAVPIFDHKNDKRALEILQKAFPQRKVIGINCTSMVFGLGTLHCRTQQEPSI